MSQNDYTFGPVLSFRGFDSITQSWKVTALVGIDQLLPPPPWVINNQPCPDPVQLHVHQNTTFWRYDLSQTLTDTEQVLTYGEALPGQQWQFTIPSLGQAPRMSYVSCNGLSSTKSSNFKEKIQDIFWNRSSNTHDHQPENAVWADLLYNHDKKQRPANWHMSREQLWHEQQVHDQGFQRFHLLMMGGDQIYADRLWDKEAGLPELQDWLKASYEDKKTFPVNADLESRVGNFYFELYAQHWFPSQKGLSYWKSPLNHDRWGCSEALSSMPTLMMWDDHDIFDGWGSYPQDLQNWSLEELHVV